MPGDPYAEFGAPVKPPSKVDPYAEFGTPVSAPAASSLSSAVQPPDNRSALERFASDPNPIPLDSYTHATLHGLRNIAQGAAQGVQGGVNLLKTAAQAWNDPHVDVGDAALPDPHAEQVPGAISDINKSPDPLGTYGKVGSDTAGQGAGQLATMIAADKAAGAAPEALRRIMPSQPEANLVKNTYSDPGDHLAASLRSNTKVDVPAEAKIAAPAIEEGLNDRAIGTKDFNGRNGPQALQSGIDNAIDIQEARAKYAIDPIRGEAVDPQILAKNPELAARFMDKDGNLPKRVTYGDLDAERIKMNKELRTSNFYSKPPSAQYAVADPIAATHEAVGQARDLVYGKVGETTGLDLRPLKQQESALIKLGDLAETTKNTLSAKAAQHAVTSLPKKVLGSVQGLLSVKANPINAFSIPEKSGLSSPVNEFNSHMQKAFPALKAATADRTLAFPKFNLTLTPSGSMPSPMQRLINLSGGEQVPGENLKLTSPEGKTPPAPNAQEPLAFDGGQHIPAAATPDILGRGLIGGDMPLTPPGDMPPALQRVLGFTDPGVPSELYPGVKPKGKK